jgi:hypothetical protein
MKINKNKKQLKQMELEVTNDYLKGSDGLKQRVFLF